MEKKNHGYLFIYWQAQNQIRLRFYAALSKWVIVFKNANSEF